MSVPRNLLRAIAAGEGRWSADAIASTKRFARSKFLPFTASFTQDQWSSALALATETLEMDARAMKDAK